MTSTKPSNTFFFSKDMKFAMNFSFLLMIIGAAVWLTLNYAEFKQVRKNVDALVLEDTTLRSSILANSDKIGLNEARVSKLETLFEVIEANLQEIKQAVTN